MIVSLYSYYAFLKNKFRQELCQVHQKINDQPKKQEEFPGNANTELHWSLIGEAGATPRARHAAQAASEFRSSGRFVLISTTVVKSNLCH